MTATTIILSGPMGKRFGRQFNLHLDTKTPAEAIRALCVMVKGFREYLLGAEQRGVEFAVWRGKGEHAENINRAQLKEPGGNTIRIAPVHVGSKKAGLLQTIVGIVLIVVGVLTSEFGGAALIPVGIAMTAGGVVQMLSPQPKVNKGADSADNQASYLFNGPVNTTAQGGCVPVLYGGPMEIGSTVISAGIDAVDYSSRPSNVGPGTPLGGSKTTPYDPD